MLQVPREGERPHGDDAAAHDGRVSGPGDAGGGEGRELWEGVAVAVSAVYIFLSSISHRSLIDLSSIFIF